MTMKVRVNEFECVENDTPIFKVTNFDGEAAQVQISTLVNVALWDQIAPLILDCLVQMKLED